MPIYSANKGKCVTVSAFLNHETYDSYTNNMFSFLDNCKMLFTESYKDHVLAIDVDGYVYSNKFALEANIQNPEYVSFNEKAAVIGSKEEVILLGSLSGLDMEKAQDVLNKNINDIDSVFVVNNSILVILQSGAIKELKDTGLIEWKDVESYKITNDKGEVVESLVNNGVSKMVERQETLFVLDKKGQIWYKDKDNSIKKLVDVEDINSAGDGIFVESNQGNYLLLFFNNKIRKFDYTYTL